MNDEGIYKEKCVNVDGNGNDFEPVLNVEDTEGVFGTDVHEVYSSTEFDCNVHKSPMHNDERIKGNNVGQSTNVKLPNQKSFSYASMVKSDEFPNTLDFVPTVVIETAIEVVIFDEEIMQKGSKRWGFTICGQFVGYDMHISELRYNIRRMWGKFGIAEIDKWKNGCYMFKFKDEIGMNAVLEKGPWMLVNVPLEAWCVKGFSVMASSLGKPILIDSVTAAMCHKGIGNISYARVLVEMDSEKELKNEIEIQYVDKLFGHELWNCKNRGNVNNGNKSSKNDEENKEKDGGSGDIRHDKNADQKQSNGFRRMDRPENSRKEYKKNQADTDANVKSKEKNKRKVRQNVVEEIRKSSNKYSVLDSLPKDNDQELIMLKERMIFDKYLNEKYKIGVWNIRGMNTSENHNEVMNLVKSENLKVCAILETRLKGKKLRKACDRIFQKWNWESNMQKCSKECRIVLGWDFDSTSVQILHQTSQSIFCVMSSKSYNIKCFYTFVYAANDGLERIDLWEELIRDCRYVNGKPWCITGDINVTLYPNEHSSGSSRMTPDMMEFQDCLNKIEVEDICKSGLHFTWTKNLKKTKAGDMTGILKKLDRVMSNEEFINQYPKAHAKFLSYIISDHTPSILCITTAFKKKIKAFRFSNFLIDK
ncbi:RNA-directed DNA polymerase, eukaryota, reverse transcriptase zinc-binding domain protein [Tanacetum coccineum]